MFTLVTFADFLSIYSRLRAQFFCFHLFCSDLRAHLGIIKIQCSVDPLQELCSPYSICSIVNAERLLARHDAAARIPHSSYQSLTVDSTDSINCCSLARLSFLFTFPIIERPVQVVLTRRSSHVIKKNMIPAEIMPSIRPPRTRIAAVPT